jgi:CDP-paratose 2-epimerase
LESEYGLKLNYKISEKPRIGDHICYISDLRKMKKDYPNWDVRISLEETIKEIVEMQLGLAHIG